jgi:hypothetical protein
VGSSCCPRCAAIRDEQRFFAPFQQLIVQQHYFDQLKRETMVPWVLFSVLAFLVFGVPLIDEVYRFRVRRAPNHARQVVDERVSLAPDGPEDNLPVSNEIAPRVKAPEDVAH